MNMQSKTTWVLVADRARARLLELDRGSGRLVEIESHMNPGGRAPDRDAYTDRAPRVQEAVGSARHAMQPHTSEREKASIRFARELSDMLERGRSDRRFDQLVLIALPQFLGVLRPLLGKPLSRLVVAEIPHEMTTGKLDEIRDCLPVAAVG